MSNGWPRWSLMIGLALGVASPLRAENPAESLDAQLARGARVAAQKCATCHGADGRGMLPDYPSLAGQHAEYIVKQLFNFKTGQRINEPMKPVLDDLMAVDLRAVAQHFATLRPGRVPSANEALLAQGRTLYARGNPLTGISPCAACHGVYATGGAQMPRLAGQNPAYLEKQMRGFIQRVRSNDRMMHVSLANMTDAEVKAVAAYLGNEE